LGWSEFVKDYHIPHEVRGSQIYVHCAWCGPHDVPKLGLDPDSAAYGCWRSTGHRGRQPYKAIASLLGVSETEARQIAQTYFRYLYTTPILEDANEAQSLEIPPEFHEFGRDKQIEHQFLDYIAKRGLDPTWLTARYSLRWTISGPFAYRIIIPIIKNQFWYAWTGRAISSNEELRYKSFSSKTLPNVITNYFLDHDNLKGGKTLYVCEGAFDAFAISSLFLSGTDATCLFGQQISASQRGGLMTLTKLYEEVVIALDADAALSSMQMANCLKWSSNNVRMLVPPGKDWGSLSKAELRECLKPKN
jgi:Toprim-like